MKFLRVMLPHCFWMESFHFFYLSANVRKWLCFFSLILWLCYFPFSTKMFVWEKDGKFFFIFWSQRVHMAVINIPDFSGSQRNTRRDTLNFSEKNVRGRRLSCLVANKQLITLPITQKRMLCGYQVILSLELMGIFWDESKRFISLL